MMILGFATVLVPYKITLLSNPDPVFPDPPTVLVPYKITLLSNVYLVRYAAQEF